MPYHTIPYNAPAHRARTIVEVLFIIIQLVTTWHPDIPDFSSVDYRILVVLLEQVCQQLLRDVDEFHVCVALPLRLQIPKFASGVRSPRHNHPYQVWCRSVQGFLIPGGLKIGVFHWQGESPLQQFCTTVQTLIALHQNIVSPLLHLCVGRHGRFWPTILTISVFSSLQTYPSKCIGL